MAQLALRLFGVKFPHRKPIDSDKVVLALISLMVWLILFVQWCFHGR